jgi:hypothetical protein
LIDLACGRVEFDDAHLIASAAVGPTMALVAFGAESRTPREEADRYAERPRDGETVDDLLRAMDQRWLATHYRPPRRSGDLIARVIRRLRRRP